MADLLSLLRRAEQRFGAEYRNAGKGGLSLTQLAVLGDVNVHPGTSQTQATLRTGIDRSTMAAVVSDLCNKQLLWREINARSLRTKQLRVTAAGKVALRRGRDRAAAAEQAVLRKLKPLSRAKLCALLKVVGGGNARGKADA